MESEKRERRVEKARHLAAVGSWWPFIRYVPPGHFYSPIPDLREIDRDAARLFGADRPAMVGIDLRADEQVAKMQALGALVDPAELSLDPTPNKRYSSSNDQYGFADAFVLAGMLRLERPRRVIEVGSGYSSALMLDVIDDDLAGGEIDLTFVEPFPARLRTLLRPSDLPRCRLVERRVQELDLSEFDRLEAGDLLFIDSSHVVKTGADVVHLITEVLPRLAPGVMVHLHDIFYPFELLENWVREGRGWTENYLLKAFLQFNDAFDIELFLHWLHVERPEVLRAIDPLVERGGGSSIYLRRR